LPNADPHRQPAEPHRVVAQRLRRLGLNAERPPDAPAWSGFVRAMSSLVEDFERDRNLVDQAFEVSSEEMRELHDQLATTAAWFRALVQHAEHDVIVTDRAGRIVYASPRAEAFAGVADGQLLGTRGVDRCDDRDRSLVENALQRAVENPGVPIHYEARYQLRDRTTIGWIEATVTNLCDDPPVNGFVFNFRDITERKGAEQRLRSLLQNSSDLLAVLDVDGRLLHPTPNAVLDYPPGSLVGADCFELVHPEDATAVRRAVAACVATHDAAEPIAVEARLRHVEGRWRNFAMKMANCTDIPAVGGIVVNGHDITDRKRYEADLEHAAQHDSLTDLPNRTLLVERLDAALRVNDPRRAGVLFVDVDHFKVLNDGRGHTIGDRLLRAVAVRLRESLRPGDTAARFGGDEFVVVCTGIDGAQDLQRIANQLLDTLGEPFDLEGERLTITVSIGLAITDDHCSPQSLLRDADAAMYEAKQRGRNGTTLFDEVLRTRVVARLTTETELRRALEHDQLEVWYQPIVDLTTGELVGAEALARWQHPRRGVVGPDEFVPIAEEAGLIVPLGEWVLRQACHDAARWQSPNHERVRVAANLSALQLARRDIVDVVKAAVADSGLPAQLLTLELTETALIDPRHTPVQILHDLRSLAVRLALDDFGTGYASLAALKRFPIDLLKIDRSFVGGLGSNPDDDAIIDATLALARTLDLHVVAEGIETDAQLGSLRARGCHLGQGFLFAAPMHAAAFDGYLRQQRMQEPDEQVAHCPTDPLANIMLSPAAPIRSAEPADRYRSAGS
jgi:diguanylate cyclase (GGDEF)-like protein/PAS domain S-box-containing protein